MANLNKVMLMGNLTQDPELRHTPSGTAVTDLRLAVNRVWFDKQTSEKKEETVFIDVTLWDRTAENACQYLSKGRPVFVEGRLKMDEWNDKESGQKRSKISVTAENVAEEEEEAGRSRPNRLRLRLRKPQRTIPPPILPTTRYRSSERFGTPDLSSTRSTP